MSVYDSDMQAVDEMVEGYHKALRILRAQQPPSKAAVLDEEVAGIISQLDFIAGCNGDLTLGPNACRTLHNYITRERAAGRTAGTVEICTLCGKGTELAIPMSKICAGMNNRVCPIRAAQPKDAT